MSVLRVTEPELEVLRMRGHGLSNAEIAEELHLTVDAVKKRLWRAIRRLNAADTAHAIALCFRLGLMETDVIADV